MSLVQIEFVNKTPHAQESRDLCEKEKTRLPKQYLELRDAFSAFFAAVDGGTVCGACFRGEISLSRKGEGCCGWCPNLGTTGCANKPLYCSAFALCPTWETILNLGRGMYPSKLYAEFRRIEIALHNTTNRYCGYKSKTGNYEIGTHPYHSTGFLNDCRHRYTAGYCLALSRLTKRVNRLTSRVKSGELKFLSFKDFIRFRKDTNDYERIKYVHAMEQEGHFISKEEYQKGPF